MRSKLLGPFVKNSKFTEKNRTLDKPEYINPIWENIWEYIQSNRYTMAQSILEENKTNKLDDPNRWHYALARCHIGSERYDLAFETIQGMTTPTIGYWICIARCYQGKEQYQTALNILYTLNEKSRSDKDKNSILLSLIHCYYNMNDYETAKKLESELKRSNRGILLIAEGRYYENKGYFDKALALYTSLPSWTPELIFIISECYLKKGDVKKAQSTLNLLRNNDGIKYNIVQAEICCASNNFIGAYSLISNIPNLSDYRDALLVAAKYEEYLQQMSLVDIFKIYEYLLIQYPNSKKIYEQSYQFVSRTFSDQNRNHSLIRLHELYNTKKLPDMSTVDINHLVNNSTNQIDMERRNTSPENNFVYRPSPPKMRQNQSNHNQMIQQNVNPYPNHQFFQPMMPHNYPYFEMTQYGYHQSPYAQGYYQPMNGFIDNRATNFMNHSHPVMIQQAYYHPPYTWEHQHPINNRVDNRVINQAIQPARSNNRQNQFSNKGIVFFQPQQPEQVIPACEGLENNYHSNQSATPI